MSELTTNPWFYGIAAFMVSLAATFGVREIAGRFGFVAAPKADRWHKRPTAMYGGIAIYVTTIVMYMLLIPHNTDTRIVMIGSSILFLVGLVDDYLHIKPYQKLFGQFLGTAIIIGNGMVLPWTDSALTNSAITVFWIIGITNAVNLLDNMDGLAAGISAIAAAVLAIGMGMNEAPGAEIFLVSAFIGALVGFLVFNFNPASIFMGDCGSMFVGFFLSTSLLLNQPGIGGRSRGVISVLAVPALTLFVPIFDTTFVTVLRKIWGRKASQGGRDHTSHRLVALGLTEKSSVLLLYGLAIAAGSTALLVRNLDVTQSVALIAAFTVIFTILGVYLGKVKVYEEQDEETALKNKAAYGFLVNLSHKRRIFEILLDVLLIALSYYAAYSLLFGNFEESENWGLFVKTLPLLIVIKLFCLLAFGVYRGIWRYTGLDNLVSIVKSVVSGSVLSVLAILIYYRFEYFSRAVFLLDALIFFVAIAGSRLAFRLFRQVLPSPSSLNGRRVLIYGAGDGGEMVLRELVNNPEWEYVPVGFIDDDPLKKDKIINGLKVYGGNGSLAQICKEQSVEEILVSSGKFSPQRLRDVRLMCSDMNISLQRAQMKIEPIDFE